MSGTIYDDIPLQDARMMEMKAGLVLSIERMVEARGLSIAQTAAMLRVPPEELTLILGGRFRNTEPETLLMWLRRLGVRLSVTIEAPLFPSDEPGTIVVSPLPHQG